MHLDTAESSRSGKSASHALVAISFAHPNTEKDRHSVEEDGRSVPPFSSVSTHGEDNNPLSATEGSDVGVHATDCSTEYFLG